jgi:hypothetical protein
MLVLLALLSLPLTARFSFLSFSGVVVYLFDTGMVVDSIFDPHLQSSVLFF